MKPLRAKSELVPALVAAGLDAARFPPLGQLSTAERGAVMTSFTKALGVPCDGCHLPDDFFAATPRKLIAGQMWEQIVRPLAVASGEPLYCDSCHQGSLLFVDRGAHLKPAADYMKANFVEKLSHGADGDAGDVTCETCHGKPFEPEFLGAWSRAKSP